MDDPRVGLGPLEAAVLDVLWESGDATSVRQVVEALDDRAPAYTTISTVLENLRRKHLVDRDRVGRVWFYRPLRGRSAYAAERMRGALSDSGDARATLLRFVGDMTPEEIDVLRGLLSDVPHEEEP